MRKEAGWQWYHSIGLAFSSSRGNFKTNLCWPHPVRGLKLLREPCFCHLKAIIVSQLRYSVGGLWKNLGNLHATWWIQSSLLVLCRPSKRNCRVIWKDLLWSSDSYRLLKYRGGCTIPLFQLKVLSSGNWGGSKLVLIEPQWKSVLPASVVYHAPRDTIMRGA